MDKDGNLMYEIIDTEQGFIDMYDFPCNSCFSPKSYTYGDMHSPMRDWMMKERKVWPSYAFYHMPEVCGISVWNTNKEPRRIARMITYRNKPRGKWALGWPYIGRNATTAVRAHTLHNQIREYYDWLQEKKDDDFYPYIPHKAFNLPAHNVNGVWLGGLPHCDELEDFYVKWNQRNKCFRVNHHRNMTAEGRKKFKKAGGAMLSSYDIDNWMDRHMKRTWYVPEDPQHHERNRESYEDDYDAFYNEW